MEIQKRERVQRLYQIPNHALDTIGNPSKTCLPPSRSSLTSYALEYDGALRMIQVSVFSNDLMPQAVVGADIYRPERPT